MKSVIALVVAAIVLALSATALADPSSPENGRHGYYATGVPGLPSVIAADGARQWRRGRATPMAIRRTVMPTQPQHGGDAAGVPRRQLRRRLRRPQ